MARHSLLLALAVLVASGAAANVAVLMLVTGRGAPVRSRTAVGRVRTPAARVAALEARTTALEARTTAEARRIPAYVGNPGRGLRGVSAAAPQPAERIDRNRSTRRYNALADRGHGYVL